MRQDRKSQYRNHLHKHKSIMSAGSHHHIAQKQFLRAKNIKDAQNAEILDVFNDVESEEDINRMIERKELNFQINRTRMNGTPLDGLIAIKKHLFKGTLEQKERCLQQWLLEFFKDEAKINIQEGYLSPRIDVGLIDNPRNYNLLQYLLYGVDFLTTSQIINRYYKFNPKLSWIDSSHVFLLFDTPDIAATMIKQCQKNKDQQIENSNALCKQWLELDGYLHMTFKRRLFIRNVTDVDQKWIENLNKNSEPFQIYKSSVRTLQITLLKDPKIRDIFQSNLQEQMALKMISPGQFRKRKIATLNKMEMDKQSFMDNRFQSKQKVYQEQMLKKMRNVQNLGDERYTLRFYSDMTANHKNRGPNLQREYSGRANQSGQRNRGNYDGQRQDKRRQDSFVSREGMENSTDKKSERNWREREFQRKNQRYDTANAQKIKEVLNDKPLFTQHHMKNRREEEDNLELNNDNLELDRSIIAHHPEDLETLLRNIDSNEQQVQRRRNQMEEKNEKLNVAVDESQILSNLQPQQMNRAVIPDVKKQATNLELPQVQRQQHQQLPNFSQSSISHKSNHNILGKQSLEKQFQLGFPSPSIGAVFDNSKMVPNEQFLRYLNQTSFSSWMRSMEQSDPSEKQSSKNESYFKQYDPVLLQKMIGYRKTYHQLMRQQQNKKVIPSNISQNIDNPK